MQDAKKLLSAPGRLDRASGGTGAVTASTSAGEAVEGNKKEERRGCKNYIVHTQTHARIHIYIYT